MKHDERLAMGEAAAIGAMRNPADYSCGHRQLVRAGVVAATRVRVTDSMIEELADVTYAGGFYTRRALVIAAFEAAGFEVEQ